MSSTLCKYFQYAKVIEIGLDNPLPACYACQMDKRQRYLDQFNKRREKIRQMLDAGLNYAEIAIVLKVSRQAVRRTVARMTAKA